MKQLLLTILFLFVTATTCMAADVKLNWDPSTGATGYKVYMSTDKGTTWTTGTDVGNVTTYTYMNVPDTGLVMFRVSAYNTQSESIRFEAGVWYCKDWMPPKDPTGIGVE